MNKLFDFDDILIETCDVSNINSRKEINVYDNKGMLPLFTAPMLSVVSEFNHHYFATNKIHSIIPRGVESSYLTSHERKFVARLLGINEWFDLK